MTQSQKDALTRSRTGGPANKLDGKAGGYRYPINACWYQLFFYETNSTALMKLIMILVEK